MPPKRETDVDSTDANAGAPKTAEPDMIEFPDYRWSRVSASGNLYASHKVAMAKNAIGYDWICICRPSDDDGDSSDENDEWVDVDGEDKDNDAVKLQEKDAAEDKGDTGKQGSRPKCRTSTCVCGKPADEFPDHAHKLTEAGFWAFRNYRTLAKLRDPNNFGMSTYNDHAGYGVVEVVQNILIDFERAHEAKAPWQQQWAVVEGAALFLVWPGSGPALRIDDPVLLDDTMTEVGRMFLTMLAHLKTEGLLAPGSEVRNLGFIMATCIELAQHFIASDATDGNSDPIEDTATGEFDQRLIPHYIYHYAKAQGIELVGVDDLEELTKDLDVEPAMPQEMDGVDLWGRQMAFAAYKTKHADFGPKQGPGIGGDHLDITTWNPEHRKLSSLNGRDPLPKKDIDAIKEGKVMDFP